MTVVAQVEVAPRLVASGQRFYVSMAGACLTVAVLGFAPTYFIPMVRGTLNVSPITHLHGLLFFGWTGLFLAQAWLAGERKFTRHRELGVIGVSLATGMCFVGLGAAIATLKRFEPTPMADAARAFAIVPVTGIVFFVVLVATALLKVRQSETHKRLLLVATISLLNAAVGRWFAVLLPTSDGLPVTVPIPPPPVVISLLPALVADLLIVAAMIHDRRTRGTVHRVYWIAGGALVALQFLRVPLSATRLWSRAAESLVALSP